MGVSKLHGKIAKAAVSVALTGAMAFGGMVAPVTQAFADTGNIRVQAGTEVSVPNMKVKPIQVFLGDVQNQAMVTPAWFSSAMRDGVVNFLEAEYQYRNWLIENNYLSATPTVNEETQAKQDARNALTFISEMISDSDGSLFYDNNVPNIKATSDNSFANKFANYLFQNFKSEFPENITVNSSDNTLLDTGYWVFVPLSDDNTTISTSAIPMWIPVASSENIIPNLKAYPSTIEKEVCDDAKVLDNFRDGDTGYINSTGLSKHLFHKFVDTGINGDDSTVVFKLTASIGGGGKFFKIEDTLPAGIDLDSGEGHPALENLTLAGQPENASLSLADFSVNYANHLLTIETIGSDNNFDKFTAGTYVFTYTAKLNAAAATSGLSNFNANKAVLHYDRSTNDGGLTYVMKNTSIEHSASIATYRIKLNCIDDNNKAGLQGATFTIQRANGDYLQADGTFKSNQDSKNDEFRHLFVANDNGEILTNFVDNTEQFDSNADGVISETEKWLTITEVDAPNGYNIMIPQIDTAITSQNDAFTAEDRDQNKLHAFQIMFTTPFDKTTGEVAENYTIAHQYDNNKVTTQANLDTGIMEITVPHTKAINLPITGMTPSQLGTIIGGALMALGALIIVKRRHNDPEQV